jgi:hypothetical protein
MGLPLLRRLAGLRKPVLGCRGDHPG